MLTDKSLPSERPTGIGVAAYNMALALAKRGNNVQYLCRGETEGREDVTDHLTVRTIKHYSKDNLGASLSILKSEGCEVFHVHSSAAAPSLIAAWALRRGAVFHSHGDQPLHPLRLTLIRNIEMSLSQRVIAVSQSTRQDIVNNHHIPSEKVVVAYNGVDVGEFTAMLPQSTVLARYGLDGYQKIVLSVGAVQPRKGQFTMVECLPKILTRWPELVYVNIGTSYDEAFKAKVIRRAAELGVQRALRLLPQVPREDLISLINAADLCVHPSIREPFGLAVVEEMACSKAVVSYKLGAIPEIIDDGVDGILVSPNDNHELQSAIIGALDDPGLAKKLGEAAREKVMAKFTWDRTASRLEEIYEDLGA